MRKRYLKVGASLVRVVHVPTLTDDGEWDGTNHLIQTRLPEDPLTEFHEAIHALSDLYGLGLSESRVRVLEQALGRFVMDNPKLIMALLRGPQARS